MTKDIFYKLGSRFKKYWQGSVISIIIFSLLAGLYYNTQKTLVYICKPTNPILPLETLFFDQSNKTLSFHSKDNVKFDYTKKSDTFTTNTSASEWRLNTTTNILMKIAYSSVFTYECHRG
jgi:hypothetical protein